MLLLSDELTELCGGHKWAVAYEAGVGGGNSGQSLFSGQAHVAKKS